MTTHTYVKMSVPQSTYDLVKAQLLAANYDHALIEQIDGTDALDMHGIALVLDEEADDEITQTAANEEVHKAHLKG